MSVAVKLRGDHKVKHYKNGTSQTFNYARCTKKNKDVQCSQKYVEAEKLKTQVLEVLVTMKLSRKFVDWAIKWLNVVNQDQKEARNARYDALKTSYEETVKKIDALLDLKLSKLISNDEFSEKRKSLLEEKAKVQENLGKVDRHIDDWTELAAKTFDFASTAVERFEKGDIEERKTILKAVGSHLILKDQKLTIEARTPFLKIQNALSEIKASKLVEPEEKLDTTPQTGDLQPQYVVWGGIRESNPLKLPPQGSA